MGTNGLQPSSFIPVNGFAVESSTPKAKKIWLHITDPHKITYDKLFRSTDSVGQVLVETDFEHKSVHVYFNGNKLRSGRTLSHYEVTDGCQIEIRMEAFSKTIIGFLKRACKMQDAEIEKLRQQFMKQHPTGSLNRADFFRHYGSKLKPEVSDHLFDLIDTNKDETIDIDEWVVAKKITEAGNLEDKLNFFFQFYDADGDGYITKDELLRVSGPLYHFCFGAKDESEALLHVEKIFEQFDKNKDGKLSYKEFIRGYKKNSHLRRGLG